MQLRGTRLCLDCEELHRADRCPVCASDAYVYLTRWVTVEERRENRRAVVPPPVAASNAGGAGSSGASRWLARGAAGLVLAATGRWLWNSTRPMQWSERAAGETPRPMRRKQDAVDTDRDDVPR
jgi:hypothetical protein